MRIPIYIAIPLCLIAVLVTWWIGTRDKDFLTPPDLASTPELDIPSGSQPSASIAEEPQEAVPDWVEQSKQEAAVKLDTFADQAAMGPSHLADLAKNMTKAKWQHLAWLAWERVIDSTGASDEEISRAQVEIAAIRKSVSPSQRVDFPEKPFVLTLHAGTAERMSAEVESLMKSAAQTIESASSGILEVHVTVTGGKNPTEATEFTPVALWITGPDSASRSSEVISFTAGPDKDTGKLFHDALSDLLRTLIKKPLVKPPARQADVSFQKEIEQSFTRYAWHKIGSFMNKPIEESPSTAPAVQPPVESQ